MISNKPGDYCWGKLAEDKEYLAVTIENGNLIDVLSTISNPGVYGSGFGVIFQSIKSQGWQKFDEREDYSSLGPRYRFFFFQKKKKIITKQPSKVI
jgi:hypothetical protein